MANNMGNKSLDLGCGSTKSPGSVGVDIFPGPTVDLVANMNEPLPFNDEVFQTIFMTDSLEHVDDVQKTLSEVARVLASGGEIIVRVPHFSSLHAYSDFTHKQFFSVEGLQSLFITEQTYPGYGVSGLKIAFVRLKLWRIWRLLGIEIVANSFTQYYEKLFSFWFPAMWIEFRLTKHIK